MKHLRWIPLLIGLTLAACQPVERRPSEEELARLADQEELDELFKQRIQKQSEHQLTADSLIRPLDMPIDASVAGSVKKVLAQHTPMESDAPMPDMSNSRSPNMSPQDVDSIQKQLNQGNAMLENGAMLINVRDYEATYESIGKLIDEHNAEIVSEEERTSDFRVENTMVINAPPQNFRKLIEEFRNLAKIIRQKRIWKQDLTASFVDLESRIESKTSAQKRLKAYLKKAKRADDILPIQRDLDLVTEELEALVQTAVALSNRTAYSTITLTFFEETSPEKPVQAGFNDRFSDNISSGWTNFQEFLIVAARYWPYIAIGFLFFLTGLIATINSRRKARQFRLQALQAQQQWAAAQQQQTPSQN